MVALRRAGPASIVIAVLVTACSPHAWSERADVPIPVGARWTWGDAASTSAGAYRGVSRQAPLGDSAATALRSVAQSAMKTRGYREVLDSSGADFLLVVGMNDGKGYGVLRPGTVAGLGGTIPQPLVYLDQPFLYIRCGDMPGIKGAGCGGDPVSLYTPCQAPVESCVTVALLRRDGRLAWRASYPMSPRALAHATPADMRQAARQLFEDLP